MTAPTNSSGLVAAYGFNEGTGTTVTDASGNGNGGTIVNTTWTASGKYGGALSFNGTNARVDIPNAASLQLSSGMTLEAWVNPSTTNSGWRDVIYKGNDNYYLEGTSAGIGAPAGGGTFAGANANAFGSSPLTTECLELPRAHLRRRHSPALRERHAGREPGEDGCDRVLDESAPDRRRQPLRSVLLRSHRRGPHLQRAARSDGNPGGHGERRELRRRGHTASDDADEPRRRRTSARRR